MGVPETPSGSAPCGGPDRCDDDLCRGEDMGICGEPSMRSLGLSDDEELALFMAGEEDFDA